MVKPWLVRHWSSSVKEEKKKTWAECEHGFAEVLINVRLCDMLGAGRWRQVWDCDFRITRFPLDSGYFAKALEGMLLMWLVLSIAIIKITTPEKKNK